MLIIGAGGVGSVVTHKCSQVPEVFNEICLASRSVSKCWGIQESVFRRTGVRIKTSKVDADNTEEVSSLINEFKPDVVVNVALPYQDLSIMNACLETGTNYLDTANYEPPDEARFEYKWQWAYHDRFKERGVMALLGCGFDPGVTNVFCAYAQKHVFDKIRNIDILDCNAGSHGHAFATNFNPEINIREVTQVVKHWDKGEWRETPPIIEEGSIHKNFDYPEVGSKDSYLLFHEEMESLVKHIKGLERMRFWMTFSENYLNHLRVLRNLGLTRIDPVVVDGKEVIPIRMIKALLPDPSSLAEHYTGKTVIGCVFEGENNGKEKKSYIYNVCDHAECYKEVGSQAISYTTGVPAMIGAMLMVNGIWKGEGVFNIEQFDPDPFMERLNIHGLPWKHEDYHGRFVD